MPEKEYEVERNNKQSINSDSDSSNKKDNQQNLTNQGVNINQVTEQIPKLSQEEQDSLNQKRNSPDFQKGLQDMLPQGKDKATKDKNLKMALTQLVDKWQKDNKDDDGKENTTNIPDKLKAGIEALSGISLDAVRIHYNSKKPAEVGALAFTQGTDIYFAPGQQGDKKLLAHELTHVVQQMEGKVKKTDEVNGVGVNKESGLEQEADKMGDKALTTDKQQTVETVPMRSSNATIQMREDNPFKKDQSHDGMELTAHHIIGHSKLKEAYSLLSDDQKKDILKRSIPTNLTGDMLTNVKASAEYEQTSEDAKPGYLTSVRARLVDMTDNAPLAGVDINGVRESFFEWQQGNQYYGPNTGIRAEPTSSKDDMDTDGQYFSDHYADETDEHGTVTKEGLGTLGKGLYDDLDTYNQAGEDQKATERDKVYGRLKKILAVTADNANESFDIANWKEVTDLAQLNELATSSDVGLNRAHIKNYTFFKIPQTVDSSTKEVANYTAIKSVNSGNSEFTYDGKAIGTTPVGKNNIFIKLSGSEGIFNTTKQNVTFQDALTALQINKTSKENGTFEVTIPKGQIGHNKGNRIRLNGYDGVVQYQSQTGDTFTFADASLLSTLKTTVQGKNLYKYLEENNAPTSTYLPKELYDSLNLGGL